MFEGPDSRISCSFEGPWLLPVNNSRTSIVQHARRTSQNIKRLRVLSSFDPEYIAEHINGTNHINALTTMTSTAETKSPIIVPISQPIQLQSTPAGRTFTHLHPVLLLAYYYLRFPSLVADPISTLFADLIPLSLFQLAYAIICLPPTKSISADPLTAKSKPSKATSHKRPQATPRTPWEDLPRKITVYLHHPSS